MTPTPDIREQPGEAGLMIREDDEVVYIVPPAKRADPERLSLISIERHAAKQIAREQLRASVILEALKAAASFIEEEAEGRANAGSEMSDYEREPRELVEQIRAAIELAEGKS